MTITPEKLDEIERLAEDVKKAGSWASDEYDHYMDFITQTFENPATVRELVRLARERHETRPDPLAEREKPCVWTPEGEDSSSWNTGCGSSFWLDDGHDGVNFCPFCGHPAVFDHEGDEA